MISASSSRHLRYCGDFGRTTMCLRDYPIAPAVESLTADKVTPFAIAFSWACLSPACKKPKRN